MSQGSREDEGAGKGEGAGPIQLHRGGWEGTSVMYKYPRGWGEGGARLCSVGSSNGPSGCCTGAAG